MMGVRKTTLVIGLCGVMGVAAEPAPVRVNRVSQEAVEIANGLVKARFTVEAGSVRQEYYAARGQDWVLLAAGLRPSPEKAANTLYDTRLDPQHRLLVTERLCEIASADGDAGRAKVVLRSGADGGAGAVARVEETVELEAGRKWFHVEAKATLAGDPPRLEYLVLPIEVAIDGKPDATHAPTFKGANDAVLGDRVFFAPLACVQQGGSFVGIVPDLDAIDRHVVRAKGARQHPDSNSFPVPVDPAQVSMPTALDLELLSPVTPRPLLAYGMLDYITHQHVWFQHPNTPGTMTRELSAREVTIAADILLDSQAPPCRGYQAAAQHLWRRFGSTWFARPRPQAMPNSEYAKACYPAQFAYQGYEVDGQTMRNRHQPDNPGLNGWQQWDADGQPVGGLRLHAPQWSQFIANLAWWNNACDATGLHYWGSRTNNADWLDKARRMVNLALAAPQDHGMFPALYDLNAKRWFSSLWGPPRDGYDPNRRAAYWNLGGAYQTAAASVTAGYLLQYRKTCEDNPRILPYVRAYGDFLLEKIQPDGCVPGWFAADLQPLPSLKWNADGGAHAWVLGELYLATKEQKYLDAAKRAGQFLLDQVLPQQRWADFEAFYSCAIKPESFSDPHTGQWPCNTMSTSWALQGFLTLHEATGDRTYLDAAAAAADFAALFQATWSPHHVVTAYPFGGMSSQLGDAEWLDQRAHRFAEPFVRIGLLTGRQDLVERGIAAGRSSLTLANFPQHRDNGIYPYADFPLGIGPENIDHEGFPQRPMASGPSWNSVGGLAGMAHVMRLLGGASVNLQSGLAVGVDGVRVVSCERRGQEIRLELANQLAALPAPYPQPFPVELRITGLPAGTWQLIVNGQAPRTADTAQLAHFPLTIDPTRSPSPKR